MSGPNEDRPDRPSPAQLRLEYEAGESINALAERHEMPDSTVRWHLRKAGTTMRPPPTVPRDRTGDTRQVLDALAQEPNHELTCAEIAELIGQTYHPTYRILRQLDDDGIVATRYPRPGDEHMSRRPYRLTEAGLAHIDGLQPQPSAPPPEPLITAITSQILLVLLQPPIRSWQLVTLANRARCHANTVNRFGRQMERAGWATRAQTEHSGDIRLTDHGVTHATVALQREYGDSPALLLLANAMCPPVKLVGV